MKKNEKNENEFIDIIESLNKKYGENSVVILGKMKSLKEEVLPTGVLSLDLALGVNGLPKGRIIEIFGKESSGKSTLALHIIKECQINGGNAAYIDVENAIDIEYAKKIGVDVNNLLFSQPDSAEQGLSIMKDLIKTNKIDIIIIDSLAALAPQKEIDGEIGDQHVALQARLMSQTLRDINALINKSKTIVIFINQLRSVIGSYGKLEDTPGGRALKFYSAIRIELKKIESINKNNICIGNKVKAKIVKNKVAQPFTEALFDIIFGKGILKESAIFEAAFSNGIIKKIGNIFMYNNLKLGVGENNTKKFLENNKELLAEIEKETKKAYENNLKIEENFIELE